MIPRFFAPDLRVDAPFALPDAEARHLRSVLRMKPGDTLTAFDGRGIQVSARIERIHRREVVVVPLGRSAPAPECSIPITLAQAVLKTEMDAVIRDATMMGVAAIQPLISERTAVARAGLRSGRAIERWRRIAVSSAKQCGRAVVPELLETIEATSALGARSGGRGIVLVEPLADVAGKPRTSSEIEKPSAAMLFVGPEGGWTHRELSTAVEAGCILLRLGGRTLRADAVALIALGVLQAAWGEL